MAVAFLSLLRHGVVEEPGDDPPLSEEGIARMELQARALAGLGLRFGPIFCSPLVRARMTAEIVAQWASDRDAAPFVTDLLRPGSEPPDVRRLLSSPLLGDASHVLVVGHAPDLGRIASALIGAKTPLSMGRGDLCVLRTDGWPPADATLEWLIPAELQARLGASEAGR